MMRHLRRQGHSVGRERVRRLMAKMGLAAIYLFTGNDRAALYSSMITGVITLSLVVVTGYTGQISLAQLTLAGVSAYILSTFATSWGIPFPIAPLLSALVAAAAGVVIGIPALRVRGLMLGVVTLTFAAGVEAIWFNNNSIDGGASGLNIPTPRLFGMDLSIGSGKDFPLLAGIRDDYQVSSACGRGDALHLFHSERTPASSVCRIGGPQTRTWWHCLYRRPPGLSSTNH